MIEDTLWIALAVFNGPFMFSLLWVLALRCEAPWTAWRPCRWLASLCEAWLWWCNGLILRITRPSPVF